MASVLADAAKRGVKVVVETHSSLLLRAVQTLIAKQQLDPNLVRLHWFTRNKSGVTQVRSAQMDETGSFGDWPEDFGDVMLLESEKEYLDAVEARVYR
jgi:predicted ATPase